MLNTSSKYKYISIWGNGNRYRRTNLMVRILFCTILLLNANLCWAGDDKFFRNFSLTRNGQELEKGTLITTSKSKTWSKGLKRSFLRLSCKEVKGKTVKLLSTEAHFSGLLMTHQHIGKQLHLSFPVPWCHLEPKKFHN